MRTNHFKENTEDLYQNAPCGFLSMRSDGRIINVNNTLLKWLNYQRDEVVTGKSIQDFLGMGGKIYFETHLMPLLQMQGEITEINMELIGKAPIQIPVLINAKRVKGNAGNQPVYRISVLDIRQRKQYEVELIKARKDAEETAKKLKQINEELEHFAYTASHDLQAPLNNITSILYLIERNNLVKPDPKGKELFSLIRSNTERMRAMIRDLLEYSKIGAKSTEFEPVSLNKACNQALEMLNDEIKNNQAVFHISELPLALGLKIQIVRLFQNLFSNAIKYRSDADPVISVSWEKSGDFNLIRVKDNGIGFEQEHERKIFRFMERLHSHDSIEGTGIGLSACKLIVEKHGGRIGAESVPGKGSTFYFTLPGIKQEDTMLP